MKGYLLLVSVMAAAARETLIFYILVFARASSNRMNALSSKRENDVIFSVFLPPKKSWARNCLRSIPDLYLLEPVLTEFCKAAK